MQRPPQLTIGRTAAAVVVALGLVLLGACSSGGKGAAGKTPIDEQLGLTGDAILQRQANAENLIRDCMKAAGFEYVPVDPSAQRAALVGSRGLSQEDFEKQFGNGITTLYEQRLAQTATGPNQQIRQTLREADRAAYDRTLYGDDPTATFAVALDTGDYTRLGGCTKQATEKVFGGAQFLSDLTAKLNQVDERILADPRMVTAIAKWSGCMRAKGFELAGPDEVDTGLERRLDEIVGPADNRRSSFDRAALAQLQRDEVAMVNADIACEKQHITSVEEKVRVEYERDFRNQNATLLSKVPPP